MFLSPTTTCPLALTHKPAVLHDLKERRNLQVWNKILIEYNWISNPVDQISVTWRESFGCTNIQMYMKKYDYRIKKDWLPKNDRGGTKTSP